MENKKYKGIVAIDLFGGAGGLSRGLQDAGIKVLAGIDFDESAKKSYEYNNKAPFITKDIKLLKADEILELLKGYEDYYFLLCGCAPCQAFSTRSSKQKRSRRKKKFTIRIRQTYKRDKS